MDLLLLFKTINYPRVFCASKLSNEAVKPSHLKYHFDSKNSY